ncbi:MAG: 4Fe-4S binding protein [Clostridiales bacterium]|nr:4Fe-4S binding protein [Clostridiales bacterium]
MNELTNFIRDKLLCHGADLVGFGDLTELPDEVRHGLPVGISVAVKYPPEVIAGIGELPTPEYRGWYLRLNGRLDMLVTLGAEALERLGYRAVAQTRARVGFGEDSDVTALPHKTVATRAGLGWIGKSALLVTREWGSLIRLSSILTDAPLEVAGPVNRSNCGACMICTEACPAGAISGREWALGLYRDAFFDAVKCRRTAEERSLLGFGGGDTICGKCIAVCPYTRKCL